MVKLQVEEADTVILTFGQFYSATAYRLTGEALKTLLDQTLVRPGEKKEAEVWRDRCKAAQQEIQSHLADNAALRQELAGATKEAANFRDISARNLLDRDIARRDRENILAKAEKYLARVEELEVQLREALGNQQIHVTIPFPPEAVPTKEDIAAALKESVGRRLMPTWQPIATAPKDKFILIAGDRATREPRSARWSEGKWVSACAACSYEPTHWMPLPEAPR